MLVARADELGELAAARADAASELVAGNISRGLSALGHPAGPGSVGLFDDLPNGARGFEGVDRVGVIKAFERVHFTDATRGNFGCYRKVGRALPPHPCPLRWGEGRATYGPCHEHEA